ncbi:MAG: zinc dependent phospholipase C family protein [Lachnospira sp.]
MNKKSHLFVTGKIAEYLPKRDRRWLLLGSILPDILFYTYLKGHTWESAFEDISKKMYKLGRNGRNNRYSYLMLGYILHYVEDFYTLAHNQVFEGNLSEHILYERKLSEYLSERNYLSSVKKENKMSITAMVEYLKKSHKTYLEQAGDFETDVRYIYATAEAVSGCLLRAIELNSSVNDGVDGIPVYAISDCQKVRL